MKRESRVRSAPSHLTSVFGLFASRMRHFCNEQNTFSATSNSSNSPPPDPQQPPPALRHPQEQARYSRSPLRPGWSAAAGLRSPSRPPLPHTLRAAPPYKPCAPPQAPSLRQLPDVSLQSSSSQKQAEHPAQSFKIKPCTRKGEKRRRNV